MSGSVSLRDQIASVTREIAMRRKVYPRWVSIGKMTQAGADHEIACMTGVLRTLQSHLGEQKQMEFTPPEAA